MPFSVHPWKRPAPMTEVYLVESSECYDWDEGRLERRLRLASSRGLPRMTTPT